MLSLEERQVILDYEVERLTNEGWQELEKTSTTCKLIRRNHISGCASLLLFFPFFVKDDTVTINIKVNSEGVIERF